MMGTILRYMGRCDEELELLEVVLEHYRRHGSYARESACQESMGVCLFYLGRTRESARIFGSLAERAPPYCQEATAANARFWLAWIASMRGDLATARDHLAAFDAFHERAQYNYGNLPGRYLGACVEALGGDADAAMAAFDSAVSVTPEYLDAYFRPVISRLTAHTLYLCGAHDRVLEIARDEVASRPAGVAPHRELFWCVLAASVRFSRGELGWDELDALDAWRGHDLVQDARLGLLMARFALERGELERAREELERAVESCELEGLTLELMTSWRLEAALARASGGDDGFALEELATIASSLPPGLPELAWWPPSPAEMG
jgi:tetratricopeptide (TPR) repeat protein